MSIKAVLFDFGGTLDSDGIPWLERFLSIYREEGVETPYKEFCRAFYDSDDHLPSRFDLKRLGLERTVSLQAGCVAESLGLEPGLADRVARRFVEDSRKAFSRNRPLLERLGRRYRLGIVSNFYGNLDAILAGEGLSELFGAAADSETVGVTKPDPRIFRNALDRLGAEPGETWMVGDSVKRDMKGAEGLGMPHAWLAGPQAVSGRCCPQARVLRSLLDLEPHLLSVHAGIIAAGEGSRMSRAHPRLPKPLVPVAGKPLVHWVVTGLRAAGVRSLVVLVNSRGTPVREYLERNFRDISWTFLQEDTASSWESFRLVSKELARRADRFLISTVDALVRPEETARFLRESSAPGSAAMALTRAVDDEKPLWADTNGGGRITALGSRASRRETATSGLYALDRDAAGRMPPAEAYGKLRDFWIALVDEGKTVRGVILDETVDVDRPEDLPAAERMTSCFDA